ncbi:MAG: hypothetical protein FWC56_03975, partial [Phycisphaerae bacterium]|nr:hypothetical protein [Phycisphaerae bacterium]
MKPRMWAGGPSKWGQWVIGTSIVGMLAMFGSVAKADVHVGVNVGVGGGGRGTQVDAAFTILNRGPVHEAYAEPVVFDPSPGVIVPIQPPELLNEAPPQMAPTGADVAWIPGYWAWDDERSNYIWISGVWRNITPGQQFVPGYWRQVPGGSQWVPGFWQSASVRQVQYLPPPPQSIEVAPTVIPGPNQIWVPGVWLWKGTGYVWRPGYWIMAQENWVWVPDHYTWTPAGYVFVAGYWDYALPRRGVLLAPVLVPQQVIAMRAVIVQPRIAYTPTVAINVNVFVGQLFSRPSQGHYYFGDYFDKKYFTGGIYPAYSFHESKYGYDPVFANYLIRQQGSRADVISRLREDYHYRRDNPAARPPRLYLDLRQLEGRRDVNPRLANWTNMAQSLDRFAQQTNQPMKFQSLPKDRMDSFRQTVDKTRQFQTQRSQLEAQQASPSRGGAISSPSSPSISRNPAGPTTVNPPRQEVRPEVRPGPTTPSTPARPGTPSTPSTSVKPGPTTPAKPATPV